MLSLELREVEAYGESANSDSLRFHTNAGVLEGRLHRTAVGQAAILWVPGAGGGLCGPAGGLYVRLAERLRTRNLTSLRLDYRQPGRLLDCVLDVLLGVEYLAALGKRRIALVGHSFGGAVVINAGAVSEHVVAVAALSSQTHGAAAVTQLSPKPLLLLHGTEDEILPDTCSRELFARAQEPKRLILYAGCHHGLDECRDELDQDLEEWLAEVLA